MSSSLRPEDRIARYGPSAGDRVRLADTDLWVRVEEDRQAPGDEPIWGYAKNLRVGLTQGSDAGPSELDAVVLAVPPGAFPLVRRSGLDLVGPAAWLVDLRRPFARWYRSRSHVRRPATFEKSAPPRRAP